MPRRGVGEETLREAEAPATYINASKLEEHPLEGAFDFVRDIFGQCITAL